MSTISATVEITNKMRVVSLACDTLTGPPFLLNMIKLSQTVWVLWPAENFGFRGDNHTMKIVRVVSLARGTPTDPLLHSYQILSKYV